MTEPQNNNGCSDSLHRQDRFIERGLASMAAVKRGAPTLSLEESMQNLRRRIERVRRRVASASVPPARDSVG